MNSKVLILVGMHRSGTSLTANILEKSGLNLGERTLNAAYDNPKGFFEDEDFLRLHIDILGNNKLTHLLEENKNIEVPFYLKQRAIKLIKQRSNLKYWGWKDPRTTLFLDFWNELIPNAKYLIIFRPYDDVVESLIRRAKKMHLRRPLNYVTGEHNNMFDIRIRNLIYRLFSYSIFLNENLRMEIEKK